MSLTPILYPQDPPNKLNEFELSKTPSMIYSPVIHPEDSFGIPSALNLSERNTISLSDKNGIIVQRIRPFSWQDKKEIVSFFLRQNNVKISEQDIEYMCLNLLANHHFIENEISKISLLKKNFSIDALNIKHILFDCFNANVFKIVDFWLQRNYKNLLKTLNETTYNSSQTQ